MSYVTLRSVTVEGRSGMFRWYPETLRGILVHWRVQSIYGFLDVLGTCLNLARHLLSISLHQFGGSHSGDSWAGGGWGGTWVCNTLFSIVRGAWLQHWCWLGSDSWVGIDHCCGLGGCMEDWLFLLSKAEREETPILEDLEEWHPLQTRIAGWPMCNWLKSQEWHSVIDRLYVIIVVSIAVQWLYNVLGRDLWHERLALEHIVGEDYVVATLDRDVHFEELSLLNAEMTGIRVKPSPNSLHWVLTLDAYLPTSCFHCGGAGRQADWRGLGGCRAMLTVSCAKRDVTCTWGGVNECAVNGCESAGHWCAHFPWNPGIQQLP